MESSIEALCKDLPVINFQPGDILIAEGASPGGLYILIGGAVEIVKGDVQITVVSDRGSIFGEISALLGIPTTATVRALSPCSAYRVEGGNTFLQAHKEMAYPLAQLLAHRLQIVTAYLADLKHQYEDQGNHLKLVDEILEALLHNQRNIFMPGSDRDPG